jgi:chromosome segregation ATPase
MSGGSSGRPGGRPPSTSFVALSKRSAHFEAIAEELRSELDEAREAIRALEGEVEEGLEAAEEMRRERDGHRYELEASRLACKHVMHLICFCCLHACSMLFVLPTCARVHVEL